ncbi:ATP-binding protein [Actinomadura madurae]|uniref:ATP-binding protein n=1 Tax=Actinomadura madurae TaxID=1993 RepID=UPI001C67E34E|nr:ATP-binding protein [Actinomadura madurae]
MCRITRIEGREWPGMVCGGRWQATHFDRTDGLVRVETAAGARAVRRGFLGVPEVVQQGRLIAESQALQWGLAEETVQDAVLVVSELLTNAVRATQGQPVSLRMVLSEAGLRVEVWDASPVRPEASAPDLSMPEGPVPGDAPDPGGWGLGIVECLSAERGVRAELDGKIVWALLNAVYR